MRTAATRSAVLEAKLYPGVGAANALKRLKLSPPPREFRDGSIAVAVISAPAGYGKSTLMSCWHKLLMEQGISCGWLSLDPDDDDPARLLRYLIAAFQRIEPSLGRGALGELAAGIPEGVKFALESLASDLVDMTKRAVLFLDDLQFLDAQEALEIVDWLIHYSPPSCQYVIGSREKPRLRLGTLRVRHRLIEYGLRELLFSPEEAAEFYESRLGESLGRQEVEQLVAKTEGWPAALELTALALRSESDRNSAIKRFTGADCGVVDYLGEVVLTQLDAFSRSFVLQLAQFDRFDPKLAEAVTGASDACSILMELHAKNLFLIALDNEATSYRFHHLAGQFFRDRFVREGGDVADVLLRGAHWLYKGGNAEEAINAAIRAEAWELACRWIAESVEELVYRRGYHQTILRWMARLPAECVDQFPTIRIHYAFALAFSPQQREVEAQVKRLQKVRETLLASAGPDRKMIDWIQSEIELQQILSQALRDDGLAARQGARAWLERWPEAPPIRRGTMGNVLAFGLKTTGEIDAGLALTSEIRDWLQEAEGWYSLAWTEYLTALLHMKRGDYFSARHACEAGLELLQRKLEGHPAHATLFHTVLATIAYEFDELTRAREHLDLCMSRFSESGQADAVLMGFLTAAKLERLARGDEAGFASLRKGQELSARRGLSRVAISLAAEECGWLVRAGQLEDARRIAVQFGFERRIDAEHMSSLQSTKATLVSSRYLLRQSPQEVLVSIEEPIARCQEKRLYRRWIELLLIKAAAQRHQGEFGSAVDSLHKALALAAPRGMFRMILDESPELSTLLDQLDPEKLRGSEAAPLVRRLQISIRKAAGHSTTRRSSSTYLVEELSKREVAILKRLESDLTNKEIASAIFISEGTLKWHLHNIYGKLAVKNRSGAIIKARSIGLV